MWWKCKQYSLCCEMTQCSKVKNSLYMVLIQQQTHQLSKGNMTYFHFFVFLFLLLTLFLWNCLYCSSKQIIRIWFRFSKCTANFYGKRKSLFCGDERGAQHYLQKKWKQRRGETWGLDKSDTRTSLTERISAYSTFRSQVFAPLPAQYRIVDRLLCLW